MRQRRRGAAGVKEVGGKVQMTIGGVWREMVMAVGGYIKKETEI